VNSIQLLPIGTVDPSLLERLSKALTAEFIAGCEVLESAPEPSFALNMARQQYSSTEILASMTDRPVSAEDRILAVTSVNLYIPILTFVFGEAQLNGRCAVVSTFRLRQEFYGLPANASLLVERMEKESVHELGHTLGIPHYFNYECVMASSHAVELIDLKQRSFCRACVGRTLGITSEAFLSARGLNPQAPHNELK